VHHSFLRKDYLNAPGELSTEILSTGDIGLTWKENTLDEEGFTIERREIMTGGPVIIEKTGPNTTSWLDQQTSPGAKYEYQVRAFRGELFSIPSNSVVISATASEK